MMLHIFFIKIMIMGYIIIDYIIIIQFDYIIGLYFLISLLCIILL